MSWVVYIVECVDGSLYTGISNRLEHRLKQHNNGTGAKYTRHRAPVSLRYQEPSDDRASASKREYAIKALTRGQKLALISLQGKSADCNA